jgi:beta-lactamase superfamily II metal-dependent hydrolase
LNISTQPWLNLLSIFWGELHGSHHGSLTFFDDPSDDKNYYTSHIKKIKPAMTLISVGPNVHDLPDKKAIELYEKYSSGSSQGNKVFTTEDKGTMKLELKNDGGWSLSVNQ